MTSCCDQGEENAGLAVALIARWTVMLLADSCRMLSSFEKARFVESRNTVRVPQSVQDEGTEVIANSIDVPDGPREQALHAIGGGFACLLSQLPAIFALGGAQNALHKPQGSCVRLWSGEAGSQTSVQCIQVLVPLDKIGDRRQWCGRCVILKVLHLFLFRVTHKDMFTFRVSHEAEKCMKLFLFGEKLLWLDGEIVELKEVQL
jgi:hypothetical protein